MLWDHGAGRNVRIYLPSLLRPPVPQFTDEKIEPDTQQVTAPGAVWLLA